MTRSSTQRTQRKLTAVAVEEKKPEPAKAAPTPPIDQATMDHINRLVGGKEQPASPFIAKSVERLRTANAECDAADRNLTQGRAEIRRMEAQLERLSGRVSVFAEFLAEALHKHDEDAKPPEDAQAAAP